MSTFTSAFKGEGSKIAGLDRLVERIDRGELDLISAGRAPFADSGLARQLPDADFGALKNSALSGRLRRSQPMTRRVRRSREPFVWKGRCQVEQFKELQLPNGGASI